MLSAATLFLLPLLTQANGQRSAASEVIVLGAYHHRLLPDELTDSMLAGIREHLASLQPTVVVVERLPWTEVEYLVHAGDGYRMAVEQFAEPALTNGRAIQSDESWTAAGAAAMLANATAKESPDKALCVRLALACYDEPTAVLHWSQMTPEARSAMGFQAPVVQRLDELLAGTTEDYAIGVQLARRLGHRRVLSFDSQRDTDYVSTNLDSVTKAFMESGINEKVAQSKLTATLREKASLAVESGDLLPLYRYVNSVDYMALDQKDQWDALGETVRTDGIGSRLVGLWEFRNLSMAANLRRIAAMNPAQRILVIVGSSHKRPLEMFLREATGLRIVQPFD
jgi:hypothetical protein